ncbi:MAG: PAS domain-containing hybrid sensor histidine kinase/response regulator [Hyphomicrobiales bacterium]
MLIAWSVILVAIAYVGLLFAVATWGDRLARERAGPQARPLIYALSIAVYCTSWTFFGSVGVAARSGFDFIAIYVGPALLVGLGWPLLKYIVEIAKKQNITSIADFIAARYGKNQALGAVVALFAVVGSVPYISLQLKAVSFSLDAMLTASGNPAAGSPAGELALIVTMALAGFTALFGTRHIDATEHQDGLTLAIAVESLVKLATFLAIGLFITFVVMGGPSALAERVSTDPRTMGILSQGIDGGRWMTMVLLSMMAIVLLPRQFHMMVVENASIGDVKRAAWLFPLYLVAINIFVVPIALAGLLLLPPGTDPDTYVLALPVARGDFVMAMVAFIGGLSAATAMVIVETVALSIMVCNNVVLPMLLRRKGELETLTPNIGRLIITIRRLAIAAILTLAYTYYLIVGTSVALAQTGLVSFAAVAQFAPAFFGGLVWRRATAAGAMAGLVAGLVVWAYTLLLPSFADAGWLSRTFIEEGLFGIAALRPRMLLNLSFDPLTHGVLWSLVVNTAAFVAVSMLTRQSPIERVQANAFVASDLPSAGQGFRLWRTTVTAGDLEKTVARYLGRDRTRSSFDAYAHQQGKPFEPAAEADIRMLRFAEHLLASAVGTASARLVLGLLLERHSRSPRGALRLLDDASAAIQHNRDLLQSAIDHVDQAIAVFDQSLSLILWNRQFGTLLPLSSEMLRVGLPLNEVLVLFDRSNGSVDQRVLADRLDRLARRFEPFQASISGQSRNDDIVVEVRAAALPDGGIVATFSDITERVRAAEALERRVEERTLELRALNTELGRAKAAAEEANLGKTRFVAAASHDILQPLNAARLFTSTLVERHRRSADRDLVRNVDSSLEAVEEILNALLDISRLDAGAMKPEITTFRIADILNPLAMEFSATARGKQLDLKVMPCSLVVKSDRRLLRRIVQNLLSNAVKYTRTGRVLMGCRRRGDTLRIEVHDTGPGIPKDRQALIYQEFERLDEEGGSAPGLGLGLSIVERIARMLETPIGLVSVVGRGSVFSVTVPVAAELARPGPLVRVSNAGRSFAGLTALVVDNEPSILEGMSLLLTNWGLSVITARSVAEAISAAEQNRERIDLLFADYHLHRDDGLILIQSIRARLGRALPALLITADRSREVHDAAARSDVVVLRKPVKPAGLRAAMARVLATAEAAE